MVPPPPHIGIACLKVEGEGNGFNFIQGTYRIGLKGIPFFNVEGDFLMARFDMSLMVWDQMFRVLEKILKGSILSPSPFSNCLVAQAIVQPKCPSTLRKMQFAFPFQWF